MLQYVVWLGKYRDAPWLMAGGWPLGPGSSWVILQGDKLKQMIQISWVQSGSIILGGWASLLDDWLVTGTDWNRLEQTGIFNDWNHSEKGMEWKNHPNWRTKSMIFQRGRYTTNQMSSLNEVEWWVRLRSTATILVFRLMSEQQMSHIMPEFMSEYMLECEISQMEVCRNRGTPPKSFILIGFSIINHPFWGTPILGTSHIMIIQFLTLKPRSPHKTDPAVGLSMKGPVVVLTYSDYQGSTTGKPRMLHFENTEHLNIVGYP